MVIKTGNSAAIKPYLEKLHFPSRQSHKGQNGKLLIVGGSSLFHAASLWAADIASRVVDMVHYCSTVENEKIFINLKSKFTDGIIVKKPDLLDYVKEDDCVLLGPGMIRGKISAKSRSRSMSFKQLLQIENEAEYTYHLTKLLIHNFPNNKFVFDAGALQMMEKNWLLKLNTKAIVTPHALEFEKLFGISIKGKDIDEIDRLVRNAANEYRCVILLKTVDDVVSDGKTTDRIVGGNAGLTKGGTGDALAGLCAALNAKNDQLLSAVIASYLIKRCAQQLFARSHFWYNTSDLIHQIGSTLKDELTKTD